MAQRATVGTRTAMCGHRVVPGQSARVVLAPGGSAHFAGVRACGSVWACPYCAAKVGRHRVAELRAGIASAKAQGLHVYLLTMTLAHVPTDPLPRLLEQLTQAQRRLRSGRGWVALAEDAGVVGLVRNLEVTWGEGSGWHPHSHALLFTRRRLKVEHVQSLKKRWMGAVEAWGGHASYWHGLKVTDDPQDVDGYLSKADAELAEAEGRAPVRGWGASEELVYSHSKKGRTDGRLTAWGLLAMAAEAETEQECSSWLGRFGLYASAFHGRRQLVWSRGLRQVLQIGAELQDEDVASLEGEGQVLHVFTALEWRAVTHHRAGPAVLDAAEEHGRSGVVRVVGWLLELLRDARPDLFETWCHDGAAA